MKKVKDIVAAIGREKICNELSVTNSAISNAISSGCFPASWYPAMRSLGATSNIDVPMAIFRWKKIECKPESSTAA